MNTGTKNANSQARAMESRVWALMEAGDMKQAVALCRQMNHQHSNYSSGWNTASQLALKINQLPVALAAIGKALELEPDRTEWLIQKAHCLFRTGDPSQYRVLVEQLLGRDFDTAYQCSTLAMLLTQMEMRAEAIDLYRQAAKLKPGNAQHFYNIAVLQRSLGEIEEAERNFDTAIRLNPTDWEAYKVRSEIRTQAPANNHVNALEKLLKRGIDDPHGMVHICYALAKELEDLEEWDRSFHYLALGAGTRRKHMKYDLQRDIDSMAAIRRVFGPELFGEQRPGSDNNEPIFILGMPRTGTTLVERILASHSDVFSAGELNHFTVQLMKQLRVGTEQAPGSRDEMVALSATLDFRALGEAYVESTRPATGHTPRFIDKLPLNYLYAGLIHLALPQAKIINLQRHPLDTCYSVFKQLFVDAYPFSYDLEELGRYYAAYQGLMEHWHEVMPGVIHTVRYEALVEDVETESRSLLAFCGLEWQAQCLKFYESRAAATTASSVQVRQPVYRSSVQKWRNFEEQLAPLIKVLEQSGVDLG